MALRTRIYTAADLLAMPDDGWRYEVVRGELRRMSPTGKRHGRVAMRFASPLDHYVRMHNLGVVYAAETGFLIASQPDTVRAPDVAFVRKDRVQIGDYDEGFEIGAPDLVGEVISPNDSYSEVQAKALEWLDAGSQMVLVIDPEKRTVTIYHSRAVIRALTEDDTLDGGSVVSGWTFPVRNLFVI